MSNNVIVIKPSKGWAAINFKDLWHYRELLYFLTWRDIKVRYKQTLIGAGWAILQPFFTMIVFTIFFGKMAKISSEGIPYPIFSYSGLLLWTYFSTAVTNSGNSLVGSSNLITKVYFPRLIVPLSSSLAGIIDYFIALSILIVMIFYYHITVTPYLLLLPVLLFIAFIAATGLGLWLSAMNVKYRDIRYAIPFLIQVWMFVSPVIYPVSLVHGNYQWLLALNPMGGVIHAYRASLLGHQPIDWSLLGLSTLIILALFLGGLYYFRRMEKVFADVV